MSGEGTEGRRRLQTEGAGLPLKRGPPGAGMARMTLEDYPHGRGEVGPCHRGRRPGVYRVPTATSPLLTSRRTHAMAAGRRRVYRAGRPARLLTLYRTRYKGMRQLVRPSPLRRRRMRERASRNGLRLQVPLHGAAGGPVLRRPAGSQPGALGHSLSRRRTPEAERQQDKNRRH